MKTIHAIIIAVAIIASNFIPQKVDVVDAPITSIDWPIYLKVRISP